MKSPSFSSAYRIFGMSNVEAISGPSLSQLDGCPTTPPPQTEERNQAKSVLWKCCYRKLASAYNARPASGCQKQGNMRRCTVSIVNGSGRFLCHGDTHEQTANKQSRTEHVRVEPTPDLRSGSELGRHTHCLPEVPRRRKSCAEAGRRNARWQADLSIQVRVRERGQADAVQCRERVSCLKTSSSSRLITA